MTDHVQIRVKVTLHVDEMALRSAREKEVKDFGLRASSTLSDLLAVVPATTAASSIANPKRVNRVRREGLPSIFQAEGGAFTVGSEDALFRQPTQQVSKILKPPVFTPIFLPELE